MIPEIGTGLLLVALILALYGAVVAALGTVYLVWGSTYLAIAFVVDTMPPLLSAGTRFLVYAQRLLELQREAKAEMGSSDALAVSLRIGAIESVLHSWLIPWMEQLRTEHPALALELSVETTPVLIEQMRRGTQDLVFTALPATADGVRSRALPICDVETGHRSANMCHLGAISLRTGHSLTWDYNAEKFTGDHAAEANKYLGREMRKPYDYSFVG